jgi:hypothetical protein
MPLPDFNEHFFSEPQWSSEGVYRLLSHKARFLKSFTESLFLARPQLISSCLLLPPRNFGICLVRLEVEVIINEN